MAQQWANLTSSITPITLDDDNDLPFVGRGLLHLSTTAHVLVTVHDLRGQAVQLRLGRGVINWFNFQRVLATGTDDVGWVVFHD